MLANQGEHPLKSAAAAACTKFIIRKGTNMGGNTQMKRTCTAIWCKWRFNISDDGKI